MPKSGEKVISGGFRDFRSDRTPPGPMNLLVITMVWGGCGRPGARRSAFSIFHEKIMEFHEIHKFLDNSWNLIKFHVILEIHVFWVFENPETPKP